MNPKERQVTNLYNLIQEKVASGEHFPDVETKGDMLKVCSYCQWFQSNDPDILKEIEENNNNLGRMANELGISLTHGVMGDCIDKLQEHNAKQAEEMRRRNRESSYKNIFRMSSKEKNVAIRQFSMSKTLYHGTTRANAKSIQELGLVPQTGKFVEQAYGDVYTFDDGSEYAPIDDFKEVVFAADKAEINKAFTAMVSQIEYETGKDFHSITEQDIRNYGALVVIKEAGDAWDRRPQEDTGYRWEMNHPEGYGHVEPGDYYSEEYYEPISYILTGSALVRVLRRFGLIPRYDWIGKGSQDESRELLIRYLRKNNPDVPVQEILDYVNNLHDTEIRTYLLNYKNKEAEDIQ